MKKIILFVVLSCVYLFSVESFAVDNVKNVKGSGKVVNKLRRVEPFTGLDIGGVFNIFISQGDEELVRVEIDDNLHQYVITQVENGVLRIGVADGISFRKSTKSNIYITIKNIDVISIGGVCDLNPKGSIKLSNLKINCMGVSDVRMNVLCNYLEVNASGVGDCNFNGRAKMLVIKSSGTRDINAKNLVAEKVKVSRSGIGDVTVNATKELEIDSSGTGDVIFYGNPTVTSLQKSGIGDIKKK